MADEFVAGDDELRYMTMLAVADYYEAESYEDWCYRGREKPSASAEERYQIYADLFLALWRKLGAREFFDRLNEARAEARRLRISA